MKVVPLNRLEFYKILGVGINSFGHIFISVKLFELITEKKKRKGTVPLGQNSCSAAGPAREAAQRTGAYARASFQT